MTAPMLRAGDAPVPIARRIVAPVDVVLALAIVVSGFAVAAWVSPQFWVHTPVVIALVLIGSVRRSPAFDQPDELAGLHEGLLATVALSLAELPDGSARELLRAVVRQARAVLGAGESSFDDREERKVRHSVNELVESACTIAGDLARLDGAIPAARTSGEVRQRAIETRELLARRLTAAEASLAALVASGLAHGTPASERIDELVAEVRADAVARRLAKDELNTAF